MRLMQDQVAESCSPDRNGRAPNDTSSDVFGSDLAAALDEEIARVAALGVDDLRVVWRKLFRQSSPPPLSKDLLARVVTWRMQEKALGGLDRDRAALLNRLGRGEGAHPRRRLRAGTVLVREYGGERHTVTVVPDGFVWREDVFSSLSTIARAITGTAWNGPRFFGLRTGKKTGPGDSGSSGEDANAPKRSCSASTGARRRGSKSPGSVSSPSPTGGSRERSPEAQLHLLGSESREPSDDGARP